MTSLPRKQSITAQDVAQRAGVSRAVVSRALSNNGSISPDTRERVLRAAEELGYQVNFLAQGLNRRRSHLIGVIVSRISDPFRSSLLDELLSEIQRRGFQALVSEIRSEQDLAHTLRQFAQFRVSGVIVTSGQPPESLVNECVQQQIPVVGINRQPNIPCVDYVCSDNAAGATLAAEQLVHAGCRHFGWLNHPHSTWAGRTRGDAFSQALLALGVDIQRHLHPLLAPVEGYEGGFQAAASAEDAPEGIFCANAQLACGFLDGMRQRGKQAPDDFQLIGFDNTPQTAQYSYQLSTLHQDVAEISRQALTRLLERASDPLQPSRTTWVGVQLIHRRTSPSTDKSRP
ncbi:LacI family DNA-binding transcriptional regulator [Klebsiella spallanzanii]|uniref:LacI family DNA-binding transcriptional regulator n=1 Tax=Klebsiella spallanzanii TaxID=2587528 RepID=UPI002597F49F|nr:LacI family DNA-binding transcriptional regulator [Klebsiella spallanzanii]MDM4210757.1 LacI family DNA-binding transcriptional regulator [Klebsiella spallanzanii]